MADTPTGETGQEEPKNNVNNPVTPTEPVAPEEKKLDPQIEEFRKKAEQAEMRANLHELMSSLAAFGISAEAKIVNIAKYDHDRKDGMVVYFDAKKAGAVLQMLSMVYEHNEEAFQEGTPLLTAPINDSYGQIMRGIAFGQEPDNTQDSFGSLRTRLLAQIMIRDKPRNADEWRLKIRQRLDDDPHGEIDPLYPAFNRGGLKHFDQIASRLVLEQI